MGENILAVQQRTVSFIDSSFNKVVEQIESPLRKLHAVTEQVQILEGSFRRLRQSFEMQNRPPSGAQGELPATIADIEERLGGQIDEMLERISRFERVPKATVANRDSAVPRPSAL